MMANKKFWTGMLVMALVFGMIAVGRDGKIVYSGRLRRILRRITLR
jgi:hypothetical protein